MTTKIIEIKRDGAWLSSGMIRHAGTEHAFAMIHEMLIPQMDDAWERSRMDAAANDAIDAVCAAGGNRCEIFGHVFEWEIVGQWLMRLWCVTDGAG